MQKIKEVRYITVDALQKLCIKHDWFTRGNNEEYGKLFDMVRVPWECRESLTAPRLLHIAQYIVDHSDPTDYEILGIEGIVFCLCEISHSSFSIVE